MDTDKNNWPLVLFYRIVAFSLGTVNQVNYIFDWDPFLNGSGIHLQGIKTS